MRVEDIDILESQARTIISRVFSNGVSPAKFCHNPNEMHGNLTALRPHAVSAAARDERGLQSEKRDDAQTQWKIYTHQ